MLTLVYDRGRGWGRDDGALAFFEDSVPAPMTPHDPDEVAPENSGFRPEDRDPWDLEYADWERRATPARPG